MLGGAFQRSWEGPPSNMVFRGEGFRGPEQIILHIGVHVCRLDLTSGARLPGESKFRGGLVKATA